MIYVASGRSGGHIRYVIQTQTFPSGVKYALSRYGKNVALVRIEDDGTIRNALAFATVMEAQDLLNAIRKDSPQIDKLGLFRIIEAKE